MRRAIALAVAGACVEPPLVPVEVEQARVEMWVLPQYTPRELDVVFVVDTTAAMAPHRERFLAAAPTFMHYLELGAARDLHVGIVGADRGRLGRYLIRDEQIDGFVTNFTGRMDEAFTELANLGTLGATNAPLATLDAVLSQPGTGFFRSRAELAVVVIAASDDASGDTELARLAATLRERTAYLTVIRGDDADRLEQFIEFFDLDVRVSRGRIERETMADAFSIPYGWEGTTSDPCRRRNRLDLDPGPDVTYDCAFGELYGEPVRREHVLPPCGGSVRPCWRIVEDERACPGDQVMLDIERDRFPPPNTTVVGQCVRAPLEISWF